MLDSRIDLGIGSGHTLEIYASTIQGVTRDDDTLVVTLHNGTVLRLAGDAGRDAEAAIAEARARMYQPTN